jgi:hypothetical protein
MSLRRFEEKKKENKTWMHFPSCSVPFRLLRIQKKPKRPYPLSRVPGRI